MEYTNFPSSLIVFVLYDKKGHLLFTNIFDPSYLFPPLYNDLCEGMIN